MYKPQKILVLLDDFFGSTSMIAHYVAESIRKGQHHGEVVVRAQDDFKGKCVARIVRDALKLANKTAKSPGTLVVYMLSIYIYYSYKETDCICTVVLTITCNDGGTTGLFVDICEVEKQPIEVVAVVAREFDSFKRKLNRRRALTTDEIESSLDAVNLVR